jgi:MOSC domain-containing protein YiiM
MRPGTVGWIGLRPGRRCAMVAVDSVDLSPAEGLRGDHYSGRGTRHRQVTLIARESLAAIGCFLGREPVSPDLLRRNLVVAGINLHALKSRHLGVGSAVLLVTGDCHPCSRMEEALGTGGYNAVRGHGGLTAQIIQGGAVRLGDAVVPVGAPA